MRRATTSNKKEGHIFFSPRLRFHALTILTRGFQFPLSFSLAAVAKSAWTVGSVDIQSPTVVSECESRLHSAQMLGTTS